jgi:hypothetical protein
LGVAITTEDGSIPPSSCETFEYCDNLNPSCGDDCTPDQVCGSDCQCYDISKLADIVIPEEYLIEETYLHDLDIPESSCTLVEGCVAAPGVRRLLRFTSAILNQGLADLKFPEPKDRPDLFEYGLCHQHYHFKDFATYYLFAADGETVVVEGRKSAACMEDTARYHDGEGIGCDKKYDCGFQGIQRGWLDSYGWSLDCSWIDVTDVPPGDYVLSIEANPGRLFPELSYDNNKAAVSVTIPDIAFGTVVIPQKLSPSKFEKQDGGEVTTGGDDEPEGTDGQAPVHSSNTLRLLVLSSFICFSYMF